MSDTPETTGVPMFSITSEPLPMPPEMFSLLGEIIILWCRVEASIQMDTSVMMQWPIVRQLASEAPHTFKKKLELWRRSVRTLYPTIEVYQAQATAFADAARKIARVRNHVMHGHWNLQPNQDGSFDVTNMKALHHIERMETIPVSTKFLRMLLADIRNLDNFITSFITSKLWHAHIGLLKADGGPSPEHQSPRVAPKPSKRQRARRSSPH